MAFHVRNFNHLKFTHSVGHIFCSEIQEFQWRSMSYRWDWLDKGRCDVDGVDWSQHLSSCFRVRVLHDESCRFNPFIGWLSVLSFFPQLAEVYPCSASASGLYPGATKLTAGTVSNAVTPLFSFVNAELEFPCRHYVVAFFVVVFNFKMSSSWQWSSFVKWLCEACRDLLQVPKNRKLWNSSPLNREYTRGPTTISNLKWDSKAGWKTSLGNFKGYISFVNLAAQIWKIYAAMLGTCDKISVGDALLTPVQECVALTAWRQRLGNQPREVRPGGSRGRTHPVVHLGLFKNLDLKNP